MKKRKQRKLLFMTVLLMMIGFASITTTLVLNGTLNLLGDKISFDGDVVFTKARTDAGGMASILEDGKKITFTSKELSKVSDVSTLNFEIANKNRQYDAVATINCNTSAEEYADYITITPNKTFYEIEAGKSVSGSLSVSLIRGIEKEEVTDVAFTCTLNVTASERETIGDEYIQVEPFSKAGTMMEVDLNDDGTAKPRGFGKFWDYDVYIEKVIFEDMMNPHETTEDLIFDVSENQDGSVMSYLVELENNENYSTYTLYIQSETGIKANSNSSGLFARFWSLKEIDGLEYFDTSNVTNMSYIFHRCYDLTNLDLSSWDTSNVKYMSDMFWECSSLTNLDLSGWDTSKVTDIDSMFWGCNSLINLNISNMDFINVRYDSSAFHAMPKDARIIVKDETAQQWVLNENSSWTTENIIIKG